MKAKRSKGSGLEQACSPRNSLVYFPWGCIINRLGLDLEGFFIWLDPEEFFITWLDCPVMWPGLTLQFQKSQLFKWWGLHMRRLKKTARSVSFNFRGKSRGSVSTHHILEVSDGFRYIVPSTNGEKRLGADDSAGDYGILHPRFCKKNLAMATWAPHKLEVYPLTNRCGQLFFLFTRLNMVKSWNPKMCCFPVYILAQSQHKIWIKSNKHISHRIHVCCIW